MKHTSNSEHNGLCTHKGLCNVTRAFSRQVLPGKLAFQPLAALLPVNNSNPPLPVEHRHNCTHTLHVVPVQVTSQHAHRFVQAR